MDLNIGPAALVALHQLLELRRTLPKSSRVPMKSIDEYHGALTLLEDLGHDLGAFKVPPESVVEAHQRQRSLLFGSVITRTEQYVDRVRFVAQLNAVLSYLGAQGQAREPSGPQIGFRATNG